MDHDDVIRLVAQSAGIEPEAAECAVEATLATLAERISAGEARDLAALLPPELAPWLGATDRSQPFDAAEFVRRVAARDATDEATAEHHARVVLAALAQAVGPQEFDDVISELPSDFAPLLARGRDDDVMPAQAFWQRVAERARLDADGARRATAAVLETLAERIAGGEVDDLVDRLDVPLHDALKRGRERSGGVARHMELDDFARRIAEREGVPAPVALAHARAVITTLREAVGDDEFFDVTVQLPGDYVSALAALRV
ncbi:MAG TPA: DUF2267 domain-containing protein [Solirubrobacteraceae bacterium]|jgi:uncharacterized protein (DUF2267 family)|nr:DUF2267 domain-containing protein [Solirubrobacteraceae bacterium]